MEATRNTGKISVESRMRLIHYSGTPLRFPPEIEAHISSQFATIELAKGRNLYSQI